MLASLCRVIKMSSPNINNLILFGCMLTYATVLFTDIKDDSSSTLTACTIRLVRICHSCSVSCTSQMTFYQLSYHLKLVNKLSSFCSPMIPILSDSTCNLHHWLLSGIWGTVCQNLEDSCHPDIYQKKKTTRKDTKCFPPR